MAKPEHVGKIDEQMKTLIVKQPERSAKAELRNWYREWGSGSSESE